LAWCLPATINYIGYGMFMLGAATLASAVARTRSAAVAMMVGFYVLQVALLLVAKLSPGAAWLENFTILSAYEPTLLATGLHRNPGATWPLFWQLNAWLFGLGAATWTAAAAIFCHRDVPAPL
jgi:ABC-type transport system involved in multi-copper enzyme maturation permease subunit